MLHDPRVHFEHSHGHISVWCDDGPVVQESRSLWTQFRDQNLNQVDASYPGLQIPQQEGREIRYYRVKVIKATKPGQYARKSAVKNAVSFKLGWAYDGANFHPGKWDKESWSISGMGSVCCEEGYQKPWSFQQHRNYPIGFCVDSCIETALCPQKDGAIDVFFRVDGFDIESPLVQARWSSWWRPHPVFRITAEQARRGLPMPALAGGINFGPGWQIQFETEISREFRDFLDLDEKIPPAALPSAPSVPSASSAPSAEEPEEPPKKKRCCEKNPREAKFCMECGDPLGIKAREEELQIIGFSVDDGLEERIEEDDWDALRALVHSKAAPAVKQEEDDKASFPIVEVPIKDVWPLQKKISGCFRNGKGSLQSLIDSLTKGRVHPMSDKDKFLILNMAKAEINGQVRYYTFDHRRCWCMLQAGVKTVRAKILLQGPAFNDLVRKSNGLGAIRLEQLRPSGWH